ncbi:hypothetical protein WN982_29665 [Paraburkholderia sp. IMGN_8]|uniref:hypothetical protein n=1 Tax=Paraburkholderia sp. IMGN_8 TaxID=3136564 RepID=UPI00310183E6
MISMKKRGKVGTARCFGGCSCAYSLFLEFTALLALSLAWHDMENTCGLLFEVGHVNCCCLQWWVLVSFFACAALFVCVPAALAFP